MSTCRTAISEPVFTSHKRDIWSGEVTASLSLPSGLKLQVAERIQVAGQRVKQAYRWSRQEPHETFLG